MSLERRSPWFWGKELATPPPADEGEVAGEAAPDPSLPTTGSRGRWQPRSLVQLAGGGVASWKQGQKAEGMSSGMREEFGVRQVMKEGKKKGRETGRKGKARRRSCALQGETRS